MPILEDCVPLSGDCMQCIQLGCFYLQFEEGSWSCVHTLKGWRNIRFSIGPGFGELCDGPSQPWVPQPQFAEVGDFPDDESIVNSTTIAPYAIDESAQVQQNAKDIQLLYYLVMLLFCLIGLGFLFFRFRINRFIGAAMRELENVPNQVVQIANRLRFQAAIGNSDDTVPLLPLHNNSRASSISSLASTSFINDVSTDIVTDPGSSPDTSPEVIRTNYMSRTGRNIRAPNFFQAS